MKKYGVLKKAITKDVADFSNAYLLLKRKVYQTFLEKRFINPYSSEVGTFQDAQVPNTYSLYGDAAMDTLFPSSLIIFWVCSRDSFNTLLAFSIKSFNSSTNSKNNF